MSDTLRAATPLILGTLGELVTEESGVLISRDDTRIKLETPA
ncbi:MAG: hypothetical protein V7L01_03745 [Nostoc sp.]